MKRLFNLKCGYDPQKDDTVPDRVLKMPKTAEGWQTKLPPMSEMMTEYYDFRGWDENGYPRQEKLASLGLEY